jgi:transcriptional regulator with XRE-family HTH domain
MISALRIEDSRWLGQQTPAYSAKEKQRVPGLLAELFRPGTGGMLTLQSLLEPPDFNFFFRNRILVRAHRRLQVRSQTEELAEIRAIFKPTVLELARLFGVSRQAIYDWQCGRSMSPANSEKLTALADAARILQTEGVVASQQLLRRKIVNGVSLLDAIRSGEDPETAIRTLIRIATSETRQREKLERRLSGKPVLEFADADFGTPYVDEGD